MLTDVRQSFLSRAIDPPEIAAIDHALTTLQELGAITYDTGEVTPLGQHLVGAALLLRVQSTGSDIS